MKDVLGLLAVMGFQLTLVRAQRLQRDTLVRDTVFNSAVNIGLAILALPLGRD